MNERAVIEKEVNKRIKEKFDRDYYDICDVGSKHRDDDAYSDNLAVFHYVFSMGTLGETFLWNDCIFWGMFPSDFSEDDFSEEEMNFFRSIERAKNETLEKYGSTSSDININGPIETSRLVLKAFDEETAKAYDDYFCQNKAEFEDYYHRDYKKELEKCYMRDRHLVFAVLLKDTNEFIGSVGFTDLNGALYNVEYFIKANHRKKGYAFEALEELILRVKMKKLSILSETVRACVFEEICLDIRCLTIRTDVENLASQRMAEKAGFEKAGTLLFSCFFKNKYHDEVVYYLTLNEDRNGNER